MQKLLLQLLKTNLEGKFNAKSFINAYYSKTDKNDLQTNLLKAINGEADTNARDILNIIYLNENELNSSNKISLELLKKDNQLLNFLKTIPNEKIKNAYNLDSLITQEFNKLKKSVERNIKDKNLKLEELSNKYFKFKSDIQILSKEEFKKISNKEKVKIIEDLKKEKDKIKTKKDFIEHSINITRKRVYLSDSLEVYFGDIYRDDNGKIIPYAQLKNVFKTQENINAHLDKEKTQENIDKKINIINKYYKKNVKINIYDTELNTKNIYKINIQKNNKKNEKDNRL